MSLWTNTKEQVLKASLEIHRMGFNSGLSGNISVKIEGQRPLIAITPSGKHYSKLSVDDIIVIDEHGNTIEGDLNPSSESLVHMSIYKARADVRCVIHAHPIYATAAAVANLEIPPIMDEMVIAIGGPIQVAHYAFPSTEELASNVVYTLSNRNAALLRNHGIVVTGNNPTQAINNCELSERIAQIFLLSHALGKAISLPQEIIQAESQIYSMQQQLNIDEKEELS